METAGSMDATDLAKVFGRHLLRAGDTPIESELVDTVVEIFLSLVREAACVPLL
jgi:hypothetical protein